MQEYDRDREGVSFASRIDGTVEAFVERSGEVIHYFLS